DRGRDQASARPRRRVAVDAQRGALDRVRRPGVRFSWRRRGWNRVGARRLCIRNRRHPPRPRHPPSVACDHRGLIWMPPSSKIEALRRMTRAMRFTRTVAIALVVFVGLSALTAAQRASTDWTQWRGPGRDGVIAAFSAPSSWPERLVLKWKAEVGTGYA